MLRISARTFLGAAAPATVRDSRPRAIAATPPGLHPRVGIHVDATGNGTSHGNGTSNGNGNGHGSWTRAMPLRAPWGESVQLRAFAMVTTEPFPQDWWRRPRVTPVSDDPFVHAPEPDAPASEALRAPPIHPERRERRDRKSLFARICLVVAGALISFIVMDAASGRARR